MIDDSRPPQDAAFDASRAERDRTLAAIHRLESALATAATRGRWLEDVVADLAALEAATIDEQRDSRRPDALLPMIAAENPRRFGSRIKHLHEQQDDIIRQVAALRSELELGGSDAADAGDLRHRIGWVIRALRHYRARQTDLVYEAIERDLGER